VSLLSRLFRHVRRNGRPLPVDPEERRQRARLRVAHVHADEAERRLELLEARVGITRRSRA
jgi:hypothetical protein